MSNLVIVALPEEDDYINRISSEKIPHMTLLFLGEDTTQVKNLNKILDFTKHAADQTLCRFSMEVDRRGVLGLDHAEQADVLFFKKSKWSGFEAINTFRSNLLQDNNIRTAYDSAEQYPEWLPHLTLGYPATPAKPDERDYPKTYSVCFDRIAVWFGEYSGIEFPLKDYEWDEVMAMSNIETEQAVSDILAHYGKLGMKWGHRSTHATKAASDRFKKQNPTRRDRTLAIQSARGKNYVKFHEFKRESIGTKKRADLKKVYLNNPDRATALRFTRGEKVVAGLMVASVVAAPVAVLAVGSRVAVRKHIEKKQLDGGYK